MKWKRQKNNFVKKYVDTCQYLSSEQEHHMGGFIVLGHLNGSLASKLHLSGFLDDSESMLAAGSNDGIVRLEKVEEVKKIMMMILVSL